MSAPSAAAAAAAHREQKAVAAVTKTEKNAVRLLTASASCSESAREKPGHSMHGDLSVHSDLGAHTWLRASGEERGLESL